MLCLGTLSASDLPESDDCTDLCVWERFQSLIYLRVSTVQTDVSGNTSSLWIT
ncbi:hypothetical protein DPMN_080714 [Dreissena polymorpha]|uniref:Uncharacterized protein n=1 Tax=Dreissena polymorpha TaxID=45954 RepID=A0A9D3YRE8_DREPO|nr:hypothetical protein DPMN_080714 [Dreissena polymorpha]